LEPGWSGLNFEPGFDDRKAVQLKIDKVRANGALIISLDFELHWGVFDRYTVEEYREALWGAREVIPKLLEIFVEKDIHATWAVVGLLFFSSKEEMIRLLPDKKPQYLQESFNSYRLIGSLGKSEHTDPYHYAASLIDKIRVRPGQEIGSHTFSHYYCLEPGQDVEDFEQDLIAAKRAARKYGIEISSLVFPRNQCNRAYLEVLRKLKIRAYRGNASSILYSPQKSGAGFLSKIIKRLDAAVNLTGHHCFRREEAGEEYPYNFPASRWLRPYCRRLSLLEPFKRKRIMDDMTYAARNGLIYHLWWHPHNFGRNMQRNLYSLKMIISHYLRLRERYGMASFNMSELADQLDGERRAG
jgi:peptidoglycan/xylan/chitin deacetylase (PgdA/CDA1 family)